MVALMRKYAAIYTDIHVNGITAFNSYSVGLVLTCDLKKGIRVVVAVVAVKTL